MFQSTLIPSSEAAALARVAKYNGVQTGSNEEPLFEVWTMRETISPKLIQFGTFNRDAILAGLRENAA